MRVAFVSMHTHHTRDTPAIRRRTRLIRLLSHTDHEVVVLCSRWWDGDHPTFEQDGISYRAVDGEFSTNRFVAKLPLAIRRADPDVVHMPNTPARHARAAKAVCRLLRVPLVVDWWAVGDDDSDNDCRRVASKADRIVAPSQTVETVVREYGAAESTISVIPEGLDFSLIESAPVNDEFDLVYSRAEQEPFATNLLWGLACGCVGIAEYQTDSAAHELIEEKSRLAETRGELVSTPQEFADEIVAAGSLEQRTIDPAYERYDYSSIVDRYLTCYRQAIDNYGLL